MCRGHPFITQREEDFLLARMGPIFMVSHLFRFNPFGNDSRQLIESVGKRGGPRLQNQRGFDLA